MNSTTRPRIGQDKRQRLKQRIKDNDFKIASWNVRTLRRQGELKALTDTVKKAKLDITAIQENRWTGKSLVLGQEYTFYYSGNDGSKRREFGTGFVVFGKARDSVIDFNPINERICTLRVRTKFFNLTLINVHAPTEEKTDEVKDLFYEKLISTYRAAPGHDIKIVLGDFNAKVGQETIYRPTIGTHSLHKITNANGLRLIDFAMSKNMVISGTYFPHKNIHKMTWRSPDGRTNNQIDHVLIDGRHRSNVMDVRSCRGLNVDSDHYLVRVVLRARIATIKNTQPIRTKWAVERLEHTAVKQLYMDAIEQRMIIDMRDHQQQHNVNDMWNKLKSSVEDAATEVIGREVIVRNEWFDDECRDARDAKNASRLKMLTRVTRTTTEDYREKRNFERKLIRRKKREMDRRIYAEMETSNRNNDNRGLYRRVNRLRNGYNQQPFLCKNIDGQVMVQEERCLERWAEYFKDLLNINAPVNTVEEVQFQTAQPYIDEPSIDEVKNVILKLKNNKSPGSDNLPGELFKHGGNALWFQLHELILKIWNTEQVPDEWKDGIICPLYKKGDKMDCKNYRGITLLNIAYKVFANILYHRLIPYADEIIGEYQCGFCTDRSTSDQIFSIRQILEKCKEFNVDTHHLFVDFKAAYDSVNRPRLWDIMEEFGIPKKLINLVAMTLNNVKSRVRIRNKLSDHFETVDGLRQGDPLSTLLFNITLEKAVRGVNIDKHGTIFSKSGQLLAYADDIDIVGRNITSVKDAFESLNREASFLGLKVNADKTKYMVATNTPGIRSQTTNIGEYNFEIVNSFVYLGSLLNVENDIEEEIRRRIATGNRCYYGLHKQFKSKTLQRKLKCKLYKTLVRPILTYGSESWCMTQNQEQLLRIFERRILRGIFGPVKEKNVWRRRYNFEIDRLYGEPDIVKTIKINRLRWLGHVARMKGERVPKKLLNGFPEGKRSAGRPKARWLDAVNSDIKILNIRDWKTLAEDRSGWRIELEKAKTALGL